MGSYGWLAGYSIVWLCICRPVNNVTVPWYSVIGFIKGGCIWPLCVARFSWLSAAAFCGLLPCGLWDGLPRPLASGGHRLTHCCIVSFWSPYIKVCRWIAVVTCMSLLLGVSDGSVGGHLMYHYIWPLYVWLCFHGGRLANYSGRLQCGL